MDWRVLTGLLAGALAMGASVPYMRATASRAIRPSALAWAGGALLCGIVFSAQISTEPSWSAAIPGSATVYCVAIAALAIRAGSLQLASLDIACTLLGALTLVVWQLTANPRIALGLAMAADAVIWIPVLLKTVRDPHSELASRFLICAIAGLLGVISASRFDFLSLGWPAFSAMFNAVLGLLALRVPSTARGVQPSR